MHAVTAYFEDLSSSVGAAWNRFWFTPSAATTLGLMRVAAGLLALYAVATYGPDLELWFGEGGMLPLEMVRSLYDGQWSLLDYVPANMLWPAYWSALVVIALFTLGVGGRAMALGATVATFSFFTRAPLVTGEFESILSFLLVYLCIGRADDAYSLKALWRRHTTSSPLPPAPSPFNTISLRLVQVHTALACLMMGWAQLAAPESAWWSGEGIWLAAARPNMSLIDLSALADHPRLTAAWSHAITLYLLAMPVFIWSRLARPLLIVAGGLVWISFAVASGWTPFCAAMLTATAAFVEPAGLRPTRELATA
ncbi:MAG: hypothetical protein JNL18_06655 [Planctomycetaceae bacterium]|nr:hypothetical protein [Planctomycetaceae bacterium]